MSCPTQRSARWLISGLACVLLSPAGLAGQARAAPPERPNAPRTTWGTPDLQGVWSTSTVTPFERPAAFEGQEFLTEEEAAEFAERVVSVRNADVRSEGVSDVTSAYNNHWYDWGTQFVSTRRTSLVIEPPTGRVPALTAAGKERVAGSIPIFGFQDGRNPGSWLERGLWERCITRGVPNVMLPTAYNNHYQIFQTPGHVVILAEMIHDARIIPLDGTAPLPGSIRQWMGNSRGSWEGETLVVETSNFTHKTTYRGAAENLHLIERFSRLDADTLLYRVTIQDPTSFTQPWTVELPATKMAEPIYEYSCHEGNYSMANALSGSLAPAPEE